MSFQQIKDPFKRHWQKDLGKEILGKVWRGIYSANYGVSLNIALREN